MNIIILYVKDVSIIQKTWNYSEDIKLCDNYFDNEKAIPILPKGEDNILKFKNIHK